MFGRVGWYICRVYTVVYPLFKTAIHDRPGRWPTATTFAKSAEIIVSPQRVFIRPMPAHRLTLISTFWLPPPFSLRASLRAFPPTVFPPPIYCFSTCARIGDEMFRAWNRPGLGRKKKKKGKRNWFWIFKLYHPQGWRFPSVKRGKEWWFNALRRIFGWTSLSGMIDVTGNIFKVFKMIVG